MQGTSNGFLRVGKLTTLFKTPFGMLSCIRTLKISTAPRGPHWMHGAWWPAAGTAGISRAATQQAGPTRVDDSCFLGGLIGGLNLIARPSLPQQCVPLPTANQSKRSESWQWRHCPTPPGRLWTPKLILPNRCIRLRGAKSEIGSRIFESQKSLIFELQTKYGQIVLHPV